MNSEPVEIPLSKGKLVMIIVGSYAFVVLCYWMGFYEDGPGRGNPVIMLVAIAGLIIFAGSGLYGTAKLFDQKPGFVIDELGFIDNSSGIAAGRVPWDDIVGLRETLVSGQRMITVDVIDPEKYIEQGGFLKAKLNSANINMTGSAINISANTLAIKHAELWQLLADGMDEFCGGGQDG
ncbi:MAG: hypothetical protein P1V20_31865 [Verrucomicrobiales bacterium]|nr:hypothetical protein [Verrucomicrobiales bacterium]